MGIPRARSSKSNVPAKASLRMAAGLTELTVTPDAAISLAICLSAPIRPARKIEHANGGTQLDLETDFDAAMALDLRARGHRKDVPGITGLDFGGAYVLQCLPDHVYVAASDPRRDGAAVGF